MENNFLTDNDKHTNNYFFLKFKQIYLTDASIEFYLRKSCLFFFGELIPYDFVIINLKSIYQFVRTGWSHYLFELSQFVRSLIYNSHRKDGKSVIEN